MTPHPVRPVREAVGYFDDPDKLFSAISDLQGAGFDRSYLSILARESFLEGDPKGHYDDTHDAESDPDAQRSAVIADTDVRQVRTMTTSIAGLVTADVALGVTIVTGGVAAAALAAAAAGGLAAALAAGIGYRAGQSEEDFLQEQIARGGIVLWVKTPDRELEEKAVDILDRNGATEAHVRDMPVSIAEA
ncbi:MAG: hypothetical protein HC871_01065 [Rhizobiales bacterium]|nr:hypothetical protein [Hyphomicrobiales bacterium]